MEQRRERRKGGQELVKSRKEAIGQELERRGGKARPAHASGCNRTPGHIAEVLHELNLVPNALISRTGSRRGCSWTQGRLHHA